MLHAGLLSSVCDVAALLFLKSHVKLLPVVGHRKDSVGSLNGFDESRLVAEVGLSKKVISCGSNDPCKLSGNDD